MKKVFVAVSVAALCASILLPAHVRADKTAKDENKWTRLPNEASYVPGEVIVQFKTGTSTSEKNEARRLANASRKERLQLKAKDEVYTSDLEVDAISDGVTVEAAIRVFKSHRSVEFAEPNWIYSNQLTANDTNYVNGSLWGMYSSATSPSSVFGSQVAKVWEGGNTGSNNVIVAVIDEGIDYNHVELAANVWVNPYEIPGNGVDDDGNGYIDDMRGWDFVNNDNSVFDGRPGDNLTDSHGTHVAGTIGAIGGNGIGVAGVNWHVTMISAKFLGSSGGTNANAVRALDYVTNLKKRHPEMNIVATNNSWGGGNYSQAIHDAIIRAAKQNILFVVAAGNAGTNLDKRSKLFPAGSDTTYGTSTESGAGYDAVITVAAIDSKGALASFSNYGPQNVDLAAPGVTIASTAPNGTYKYMNGTSMATPHVTGTAAIYAAAYPWAAPWTIRSAILSSAVWTPSLNGKVGTNGRLNAYEALRR